MTFKNTSYCRAANTASYLNAQGCFLPGAVKHPKISYGQVDFEKFSKHYKSSGWIGRKITAIPTLILISPLKIIYHLALYILNLLTPFPKTIVLRAGIVIRDLEEAVGHITVLFYDKLGSYLIQESEYQKTCYRLILKNPLMNKKYEAHKKNEEIPPKRSSEKDSFPNPPRSPSQPPSFDHGSSRAHPFRDSDYIFNAFFNRPSSKSPAGYSRPRSTDYGFSRAHPFRDSSDTFSFFNNHSDFNPIQTSEQRLQEALRINCPLLNLPITTKNWSEIRKAYLRLAGKYHPDKYPQEPGENEENYNKRLYPIKEKFCEVKAAYDELEKLNNGGCFSLKNE